MNNPRMNVDWSIFGSHLQTDSRPLMAVEILGHSRPVRGVKLSSRIERERYRTVLLEKLKH